MYNLKSGPDDHLNIIPIDPAQIPQQLGPKIQHRPTPSYPDPYARPPPKPPDISVHLNSRERPIGQ